MNNVEGRERFFRAIAERIDVERVEGVHVFPAIRQGGRESGVAVLTLRPESAESEIAAGAGVADGAEDQVDIESGESITVGDDVAATVAGEDVDDAGNAEDVDDADDAIAALHAASSEDDQEDEDLGDVGAEVQDVDDVGDVDLGDVDLGDVDLGDVDLGDVDLGDVDLGDEAIEPLPAPPPPRRFTVLRAHYRLQLKGPDRGKWEVAVVEEADAPSATVDEVVRGVHERAGGWSVEGPERLTGDEFRAALVEEPWSATR